MASADAVPLPPAECVQLIREARIARLVGDEGLALRKLQEAERRFPGEILPVVVLLEFERDRRASDATLAEVRARLRQHLFDFDAALPQWLLRRLVEDTNASRDDLVLLRQAIEARLGKAPKDPHLLDGLALVQERLEDPAAARETVGKLLEVRREESVIRRCVDLDLQLERWEEAIPLLRELRALHDDDALLRWTLGRALAKTGRYDEASAVVAPLLENRVFRPPLIEEILLPSAWALYDQGRTADAEKIFRSVVARQPGNAEATTALLHLYASSEERDAHAAAIAKHWEAEPDPSKLVGEAAIRIAAGDALSAYSLLERATTAAPGFETAWFDLGLAAVKLERWEEAVRATRRALELKPDRADAHLNLGIALTRLDKHGEAIRSLERALELEPDLHQAHDFLRYCYEKVGDAANASKHRKLAESAKESR